MRSLLLLGAALSIWIAPGCDKKEVAGPPPVGVPLASEAVAHAEWEWHRVSLERYPFVRGRVFGPDGEPFEGATATLCIFPSLPVQPPKLQTRVATDASGLFVFEDVPANARIVVEGPDLVSVMLPAWMLVRKGVDAVEARLRRGGSVEGVLRTPTNEPLPAYPVWARAGDPDWYESVLTDDEGRYRFPAAPPGQVILGALRRGKLGGVERAVKVQEGVTTAVDLLARELPPVVGRVVDLKTGDPIPKALVVVVTDREHVIVADEEGRFRIEEDCLPAFLVRADGYGESRLFVDPGRTEEQPVLARLGPGGRVYGRVVDEEGRPLAGARIRALVEPERVAATISGPLTDEDGRFAFTWIPLGPDGAQVAVLAEGAEMHPAAADAVHILPGGAIENVTLTLEKPVEVSFRLVDEKGVPWPRAEVSLEWREGPPPGAVRGLLASNPRSISDGEGRVRVTGLRRGLGELIVSAHRRMPWSRDVRVEGRPGEDLGDILLPRGLALAGRVESTAADGPPRGATLHLVGGRARQSLSIDIDPDGSFLLEGLEPGTHTLRGEAPAHESTRIRAAAGRRDLVVRLRAYGALHVTLLTQEGSAEGMVELTALTGTARRREPYRRGFADVGEPVLFPRLEAGKYRVRVFAGDHFALGEVVVPPGPPANLKLDLKRGGVVEGRLRAATGVPMPGVGVQYESGGGWGAIGRDTDARGGFRFTGIPPGEIKVASHPVGYPPAATTVRVAAGETTTCDLTLRTGGKLRIRVHGSDGKPVIGAAAALTDLDGTTVRFWVQDGQAVRTNADGELVLTGIPAGTHRLVVSCAGKRTEPKEIQVVEGEVRDVPVVLDR